MINTNLVNSQICNKQLLQLKTQKLLKALIKKKQEKTAASLW